MLSTRILLRKDRMNGEGKCPLTIRITKARKSAYLSTGIKLLPNQWDNQRQKIKSNFENHVRANGLVQSIKAEAESIALEYELDKVNYSVQTIKELVVNNEANKDVILFAAKWIKERYSRKEITYSTVRRYEAVLEKVKDFREYISEFTARALSLFFILSKLRRHLYLNILHKSSVKRSNSQAIWQVS